MSHPGRRLVVWGNANPFLTSIIFSLLIVIGGLTAFQIQAQRTVDSVAAEATERRIELAKAVAASQKDVCERAVIAVTNQSKADDLKLVKALEDRFTEQGKPVPVLYLNLELLITNRQPPTAACEPKESP